MTARSGIACAGNWIVDIVHTIDRWPRESDLTHIRSETTGIGGGAANVALDLTALGAAFPVVPVGLVGADPHGRLVREALARAGLSDALIAGTGAAPTAHTHVMTVPGQSRTFFYHPGCNDLLGEDHIPLATLAGQGLRFLYLGYLNLMGRMDTLDGGGSTPAARVLRAARAAGLVTCVDLVSADTPAFRAVVAAALPFTDYLFLNETEAARATGQPVHAAGDRDGILAAAQKLRAGGAGTVVVHTPEVALWLGAVAVWQDALPVPPEAIRSPVGAGDAFCAGCLFGLHAGWPPARCLSLGHAAAAASLRGATATEGIPPAARLADIS